jgi:hypothetical protein
MKRILRTRKASFALIVGALFALAASIELKVRSASAVAPNEVVAPEGTLESGEAPSNEIRDFPQLD